MILYVITSLELIDSFGYKLSVNLTTTIHYFLTIKQVNIKQISGYHIKVTSYHSREQVIKLESQVKSNYLPFKT